MSDTTNSILKGGCFEKLKKSKKLLTFWKWKGNGETVKMASDSQQQLILFTNCLKKY